MIVIKKRKNNFILIKLYFLFHFKNEKLSTYGVENFCQRNYIFSLVIFCTWNNKLYCW